MNQNSTYGGVIWTHHALERLHERSISQGDAYLTFTKADHTRKASSQGGWVYEKTLNGWNIEVVAKQNEKKEWIILSVWAKPVYFKDEYEAVKKRSWFNKFLRKLFFGDYR